MTASTYNVNQKHLDNVLKLDGPHRYSYFIKHVADWGEMWSLEGSVGLVLAEDSNHSQFLPLWPHEKFAQICIGEEWGDCKPSRISIEEWLDKLSKKFMANKIMVAIFPLPSGKGIKTNIKRLNDDLESEISLFEDI